MCESYYEWYCSWNSILLHSPSFKMFHYLLIDLVFLIFFPILFLFLILFLRVLRFFLHHLLHLQILRAQFWPHLHYLITQLFGLHRFLSSINVFDFSCAYFLFLFWHYSLAATPTDLDMESIWNFSLFLKITPIVESKTVFCHIISSGQFF